MDRPHTSPATTYGSVAAKLYHRGLELLDLPLELPKLGCDHQRRHQYETVIANLAELLFHRLDMGAEIFSQRDEMGLFSFAAFEAIGAPIERDGDVSQGALL